MDTLVFFTSFAVSQSIKYHTARTTAVGATPQVSYCPETEMLTVLTEHCNSLEMERALDVGRSGKTIMLVIWYCHPEPGVAHTYSTL